LSRSREFQELRSHSNQENELLKRIRAHDALEDIIPKTANKKQRAVAIKPLMLILAHMFRLPQGSEKVFADDMDYIRRMAPQMITLLNSVIQELQGLAQRGQSPKRMPSKVIEVV
jgi:hypothetical protein